MMSTAAVLTYPHRMESRRLHWSLIGLAAMSAPHALHLPVWVTAGTILLGLWRLLVDRRGKGRPGRYLRLAIALAAFAGVAITFRTLNGPEAGTSLLLLLTMLKLMESKELRDYFLLVVIAYFIGIANFLYDQTIPLALYMVPAVWLTTAAFLNVAHPDSERGLRDSLRISASLLLPAVPVAAVLFLLFPRVPGPLWGLALPKHSGVTGLSSTMTPGDLSQLAQSDSVAFHVRFSGPVPPRDRLYWRALVLHDYDGKTWSSGNVPWVYKFNVTTHGEPVQYEITLEPNNLNTLYALDLPTRLPDGASLSASYETNTRTAVMERKLYGMTSYTDYTYGTDMPRWMLHRDTKIPPDMDPRAVALAVEWRSRARSPGEVVQDALLYFRQQPFRYTLSPGTLTGADTIDQFLFQTRQGFCEHYAGAFVFLMRAAGIPAHVVIGYQGGELNPVDGYYVVRQSEAHAWAEVWLAGQGWVRVDPTAAVDPARVEQGIDSALSGEDAPGILFRTHPWLTTLRNSWDAVNNGWNQWVLAYGPELQQQFFKHVGLDYGNWAQLAVVLLVLVGTLLGAYWLYLSWQRRPPPAAPVVRLYKKFCRKLARFGLVRAGHEGPQDFAARAVSARPAVAGDILAITRLYVALRYGGQADETTLRELAARIRAFRP